MPIYVDVPRYQWKCSPIFVIHRIDGENMHFINSIRGVI